MLTRTRRLAVNGASELSSWRHERRSPHFTVKCPPYFQDRLAFNTCLKLPNNSNTLYILFTKWCCPTSFFFCGTRSWVFLPGGHAHQRLDLGRKRHHYRGAHMASRLVWDVNKPEPGKFTSKIKTILQGNKQSPAEALKPRMHLLLFVYFTWMNQREIRGHLHDIDKQFTGLFGPTPSYGYVELFLILASCRYFFFKTRTCQNARTPLPLSSTVGTVSPGFQNMQHNQRVSRGNNEPCVLKECFMVS